MFQLKNKWWQENKKGMSILFVFFIATILLSIGFGISGILISQIKMLGEAGYSVVAFYAADSGIEQVLNSRNNPENIYETELANGASYYVQVLARGEGYCPDSFHYCIKSIGSYRNIKRAIEISY